MNPETSAAAAIQSQKQAAPANGEPALALIATHPAIILLLARRVHTDPASSRYWLDQVTSVEGYSTWVFRELALVTFSFHEGRWHAEDGCSHQRLVPPRQRPFPVAPIPAADHQRLQNYAAFKRPWPILHYAQRVLPELPLFQAAPGPLPEHDPKTRVALYSEYQKQRAARLAEIWVKSEQAECDPDFLQALSEWVAKHRTPWRKCRGVGFH